MYCHDFNDKLLIYIESFIYFFISKLISKRVNGNSIHLYSLQRVLSYNVSSFRVSHFLNGSCIFSDVQGNPMALMALSGAGGAGGGGVGSMMMRLLNNPYTLCKETEGVKAIPCRSGNICNLLSIRQYRMPNLMKCSPAGIGCCLKDYMSLQLSKMMN